MFVREALRCFPIANSMVSRKCVIDDCRIDIANSNYYIPKGINIVVDVLSIHYDPVSVFFEIFFFVKLIIFLFTKTRYFGGLLIRRFSIQNDF